MLIKKLTDARMKAYKAKHNEHEPIMAILDDAGNEYFIKDIRVNLQDPELDVIEMIVE